MIDTTPSYKTKAYWNEKSRQYRENNREMIRQLDRKVFSIEYEGKILWFKRDQMNSVKLRHLNTTTPNNIILF